MIGILKCNEDIWTIDYTVNEQVYPRSGRDAGGNERYEDVQKTINYYPIDTELGKAFKNIDKKVEFSFGYKTQNDYYNKEHPHAIINWHYLEKENWDMVYNNFDNDKITIRNDKTSALDFLNWLEENYYAPIKK